MDGPDAAGIADGDEHGSRLRKLVALVGAEAAGAGDLVPLLADLLSIDYSASYAPLQMSPQRQKQKLFQALMHILELLARRRPLLVVVEDLHWADPSSDELIGALIDRARDLPVLAVLSARPEFESHWQDRAHLLPVRLTPLERADSIAMIELLCGAKRIPEQTIGLIAAQTDGVPLFIEDLTRDVLEADDLGESRDRVSGQTGRSALAIPATLSDSLMSRLDRLGPAKRVAQVAACIGREFSYEVLGKLAELPEEDLKEQLYSLVDCGLLLRLRSTPVSGYRFKHALVRDAAYASLLKKEQAALHSRIAGTLVRELSELEESRPELLAYHCEAAGEVDKAVHYLVEAAQLSAKRSGFVEAVSQLERALSLLETQAPSRGRAQQKLRVYQVLGAINAEFRGFSAAECGAAYTKALELCRELGDAPEIFSLLSCAGSFHITRAEFA